MRILFYTVDYKPLLGGIAEFLYNVALEMSKRHHVVVLAPDMPGAEAFDKKQPFTTHRFKGNVFLTTGKLRRIVKEERIGIVYAAMWYPTGLIASFFSSVPYIVQTYAVEVLEGTGSLAQKLKRKMRWLRLRIFNRSLLTFAISRYTMGKLREIGVRNVKLHLCGIRQGRLAKGKKRKRFTLLTVARLVDYKGQDMVLRALPSVLEKHDVEYVIVGKGPHEQELRRLAKELGVEKSVTFAGAVSEQERERLYAECDCFIMCSRAYEDRPDAEGFGIVFLEAHRYGKPVIGGDEGGIPDAVTDGKTGLLCDPWKPEAVARTIKKIIEDPSLARRLGTQGLKRLENELDWELIVPAMERDVEKALGENL